MKLYTYDQGWAGLIVVIATSREDAFNLMKKKYNIYSKSSNDPNIEEHEIVDGFCYENKGDQ